MDMTKLAPDRLPDYEFAQDTVKANIDNRTVPPLLHWLPALFLIGVVGVGAGMAVFTPAIWNSPAGKTLLTGSWQSSFEHTYDQEHPVRTPGVDTFGVLNYSLFDEGRPGVLIGSQGWLYTTEEFQAGPDDAAQIAAKLKEIGEVRRTLAARNTRLLVLLVPAKSRVYPEHLGRYIWPTKKQNVYESFRQQLTEQGIVAPDLLPALVAAKSQGQLFLRTDTHWTPLGARVAANVVRTAVSDLTADVPPARFQVDVAPNTSYSGDLLKYVPLGPWQSHFGPKPDRLITPTARRTDSGGGGLLGDETPAITLVGTSYSANKKWGFESLLKGVLGADLVNAAQEGKGPMVPMREYLKSTTYKDSVPKLVIWEIPERFLGNKY